MSLQTATPTILWQVVLPQTTETDVVLNTVTVGVRSKINSIFVYNSHTAALTITFAVRAWTDARSVKNTFTVTVWAWETKIIDSVIWLNVSDRLTASTTVAAVVWVQAFWEIF